MDEELETHHQERERLVNAVQSLADGTPALGIVAAVLGVIKTMGAISEPPEVLGHLIGGALVGTFLGVFVAYGFFGPMAQALRNIYEAEHKYFLSMKVGLLAHISGYAPVDGHRVRPQDADERGAPDLRRDRRGDGQPAGDRPERPFPARASNGRLRQARSSSRRSRRAGTPIMAAPGRSPMPTS
jgi:hypothetical protein